jgi:hypothetical protein
MLNKTYKDNLTGEIIKIVDVYENIAITDNKSKIDSRRLLDERFYTEWIDPKAFFSSETTYSSFVEKISSIDLTNVPEDINEDVKITTSDPYSMPSMSESAVVQYDPEEERRELARKYGVQDENIEAVQKQNEAFSRILNDENKESTKQPTQPTQQPRIYEEESNFVQTINVEDPIITMFKNVKRKEDFSLDLKIESKIPRLDFIEMMEDSYEISIIEFLAEEMTNNLLSNPEFIKDKIVDEIKSKLSNSVDKEDSKEDSKEEQVKVTKPRTRNTRAKKEPESNDK